MTKTEPQLILAGNSSWLNRGCEAIELGIRCLVSGELPGAHFVVAPFAGGDPRESEVADGVIRLAPVDFAADPMSLERVRRTLSRRLGFPSRHRAVSAPYRYLDDYLRSSDALLQIGGDNFTLDYGRPDRFFALNDRAMRLGCPVVLWGATIGPFSSEPGYERYVADQLSRVDLILCRDHSSIDYLRSIGVSENVRFAMDPAFALSPEQPREVEDEITEGTIAVNVSPLYAKYAGVTRSELAARTAKLVGGLLDSGASRVLLVPHVMLPGQNDYEFALEVRSLVGDSPERVSITSGELSASELKWVASQCSAVIAARTHLTIAGFSSGVPTISLAYSAKAAAINREVYGNDEWVVDAADFTPDRVVDRFVSLQRVSSRVGAELAAKTVEFKVSAASAARELAALLASGRNATRSR